MKKLTRVLLFSSVTLYLTASWNKGFLLPSEWLPFLQIAALLAVTSYLVVPLSKIVLFPIHVLTFGLLSLLCYFVMFYLVDKYSGLLTIKEWVFPEFSLLGVSIQKIIFSPLGNLFAVSASSSVIINSLEKLT